MPPLLLSLPVCKKRLRGKDGLLLSLVGLLHPLLYELLLELHPLLVRIVKPGSYSREGCELPRTPQQWSKIFDIEKVTVEKVTVKEGEVWTLFPVKFILYQFQRD